MMVMSSGGAATFSGESMQIFNVGDPFFWPTKGGWCDGEIIDGVPQFIPMSN